jgi:hypothetical protein
LFQPWENKIKTVATLKAFARRRFEFANAFSVESLSF